MASHDLAKNSRLMPLSRLQSAVFLLRTLMQFAAFGKILTAEGGEFNGWSQQFNLFWKDGVLNMKYRQRTFYADKQKSEMWD